MNKFFLGLAALLLGASSQSPPRDAAPGTHYADAYTLVLEDHKSFVADFPARNPDGTINMVVEIPAGTSEKWEVGEDGTMKWEFKNGRPRVVKYLPYPGNYGMVPRTLLPKELGGDGDPLDVLVLGPALPRGTVCKAHLLGVMKMLDGGEVDDKLLAVLEGTALAEARDLKQLQSQFPGVTEIVATWFGNYKGPGVIETRGFADVATAEEVLSTASRAYEERHGEEPPSRN